MDRLAQVRSTVCANVQTAGFHVTGVFPTENDPGTTSFSYTTGFHNLHHPEILIVGLHHTQFMPTYHTIYDNVKRGITVVPNVPTYDVIQNLPVVFKSADSRGIEISNVTRDYYQHADFRVWQMFYPDRVGRFPWDVGYELSFAQELPPQ